MDIPLATLILLGIILPPAILLIREISSFGQKEDTLAKQLRSRSFIILIALSLAASSINPLLKMCEDKNRLNREATNNRKILLAVADELEKNLAITYEWIATIEISASGFTKAFSRKWEGNEFFLKTSKPDLVRSINRAYGTLQYVDLSLNNFRTGAGFAMPDESKRMMDRLKSLAIDLKSALKEIEKEGIKKVPKKIKPDVDPSSPETIKMLIDDYNPPKETTETPAEQSR